MGALDVVQVTGKCAGVSLPVCAGVGGVRPRWRIRGSQPKNPNKWQRGEGVSEGERSGRALQL